MADTLLNESVKMLVKPEKERSHPLVLPYDEVAKVQAMVRKDWGQFHVCSNIFVWYSFQLCSESVIIKNNQGKVFRNQYYFFLYVPLLLLQGFIYFVVDRRSKKWLSVTSVIWRFLKECPSSLLLLLPLEYVFVNIGPKIAGRLCQWIFLTFVSNRSFCEVVKDLV